MAAASTILAITAALVGAGATTYSAIESKKAQKEQNRLIQDAAAKQDQANADMQARLDAEEKAQADAAATTQADAERATAQARQKQKARAASGRADTILTSPLGLETPGIQAGSRKTLLGS